MEEHKDEYSLVINHVVETDLGTYTCKAMNRVSITESVAQIQLLG